METKLEWHKMEVLRSGVWVRDEVGLVSYYCEICDKKFNREQSAIDCENEHRELDND